ncbi:hypothetical protein DQY98_20125 [Salmonella enterica subsp. enterica serovar Saintpaul]|nr:hypothetical protein [Salmonella enterica subsp. enterica serovar Saintpaul]EBX0752879.1 hypothetical protein [Salmonella enterica subsp. enterica serovar Saintpaul]ECB0581364.1 hypothetical protein [Salmonella enterica subsp. enterica serovar Saintpaul]ECI6579423.1 hypothetical protein [Salmonella enterica subsp. enterica serovar Saintpaul]
MDHGRLRHQVFLSLSELNLCIRTLVANLNEHPFKNLPGNRRYRHNKKVKVNINYHVECEQHHYSIPLQCVGHKVELHGFDNLLEVWMGGQMLATHPQYLHPGYSTTAGHMPERHLHHQ